MKIGVLTGGGDCAGLNATIRGLVARSEEYGHEVVGIERGWKGLIDGTARKLSYDNVEELVGVGGTVILTSRTSARTAAANLSSSAKTCRHTLLRPR